jgi:hypothetical protein
VRNERWYDPFGFSTRQALKAFPLSEAFLRTLSFYISDHRDDLQFNAAEIFCIDLDPRRNRQGRNNN